MTVERAGEGAGGRRRRWSGGGCGGLSVVVELAGEGAGGAWRRGGSGKGDLARGDSDRDEGGSISSVDLMNIQYFFILNKYS